MRLLLSRVWLALWRWKVVRAEALPPKCVMIAAPHTSNWDGVLLLALAPLIPHRVAWMIKDDWLRGPMGTVLRRLGAVGIDRSKHTNVVRAFFDSGRLKAGTPSAIASMPVRAVQPAANERSTRKTVSASASGGMCATSGAGAGTTWPPAIWYSPEPIRANMLSTNV